MDMFGSYRTCWNFLVVGLVLFGLFRKSHLMPGPQEKSHSYLGNSDPARLLVRYVDSTRTQKGHI